MTDGHMKFRKKPVIIEAVQWTGKNPTEIILFCKGRNGDIEILDGAIYIRTLEGIMRADANDYIIAGVQGELYPCKEEIFLATYEAAE